MEDDLLARLLATITTLEAQLSDAAAALQAAQTETAERQRCLAAMRKERSTFVLAHAKQRCARSLNRMGRVATRSLP
jgi:hypothetical protein